MNEINNIKLNNLEDEMDLIEIFNVIFKGKIIIISITAFVSFLAVAYSLLLPNIYESKTILAPVNPSSSISGALGAYSGLAGIAGISVPSNIDEGNSAKALKKIKTLSFFEENIFKNIYLPDLIAVKSWDSKTNSMAYDNSIYNTNNNTWVRDYSYPQQQVPSAQESFKIFNKVHLSLNEDTKSGFITLSIRHQSPYVARQWVELVVDEVNNFYREKDKVASERAVSFLNQQISMTGLSEIKEVLANLLQEETKKLTLIEANESYVFEYIDPPVVMEEKSQPKRFLICLISATLGVILSISLVLLRHYIFHKRTS